RVPRRHRAPAGTARDAHRPVRQRLHRRRGRPLDALRRRRDGHLADRRAARRPQGRGASHRPVAAL
ncbi:hypothetical protein LTR94_038792, partial [Friedmanniomyces endolithicus]